MTRIHSFLLPILLSLATLPLWGKGDVKFRSGSTYQIRCVGYPTGALAPNPQQRDALILSFHSNESTWWDITLQKDGSFTIRSHQSKQYLTYHGERSEWLRYAGLTTLNQGDASRWHMEAAQEGFVVSNAKRTDHWLNVRPRSYIAGTYVERKDWPDDNELFYLVDRHGQVVTLIGNLRINLSDACRDAQGKAPAMVSPQTASSATSHSPQHAPQAKGHGERTYQRTATQGTAASSTAFRIDGQSPAEDHRSGACFFSLPQKYTSTAYSGRVSTDGTPKGAIYFVDGVRQGTSGQCRFGTVTGGRHFRLAWTSAQGDTLGAAWVCFTFLPIVQLHAQQIHKGSFSESTFQLTAPDSKQSTSMLNAQVRHRGEYTYTFFTKKSLAVKLKDTDGRKFDLPLLGMRRDNYWILDAMPNDPARFRNRLAQDLWLQLARRPYFQPDHGEGLSGVRGQAVELFLNGKYEGLYFLTERMDRRQLGLKRKGKGNGHGCLYKGNQWTDDVLMTFHPNLTLPSTRQHGQGWNGWEAKYPEPSAKQEADWTPLVEAVTFTRTATDEDFKAKMNEVFDVEAVMDYYLFMSVLFAIDNTGKNMYWAVGNADRSHRLTPAPWDLDATMGMRWDGARCSAGPASDYAQYLTSHGNMHGAFLRISKCLGHEWNVRMSARYSRWRSSSLTVKGIMKRIDAYYRLLSLSGADQREMQRWNSHGCTDFRPQAERQYLQEWFTERLDALDKAVKGMQMNRNL